MTRKSTLESAFELYHESGNNRQISPHARFALLENWDYSATIKYAVVTGLGYIPMVGGVLSKLTSMFWPTKKDNVWERTLREIKDYIDHVNLTTIQGILNGEIQEIYVKMERVSNLLENNPNTQESLDAYKNLSDYLVGKDRKFRSFSDAKVNYQLLPMYASMILLQVSYWRSGVERNQDIGLTELDIKTIERDIQNLVKSAEEYVQNTYSDELDRVLDNAPATSLANDMFTVRGYCLLHGVEAVRVIESIMRDGLDNGFNIDVISYSTLVEGTITAGALTQALKRDEKMKQPLRPEWKGDNVNQIASITGYVGPRIDSLDTIGGLRIRFEDGAEYELGATSGASYSIQLNGSKLARVEVWFQGLLEGVLFTLDDDRTLQIGAGSSRARYRKFEVDNHYISGLFLDRDQSTYRGRSATMSVSYHIRTSA